MKVEEMDGYRQITIPAVNIIKKNNLHYYTRSVICLLKEFTPPESDCELIFHLNFMNYEHLVKELKKAFRCKMILTVHYTNWSFALSGDYKSLVRILNTRKKELNGFEKKIANDFREDIRMINRCDRLICIARHSLDSFIENSNINKKKCFIINNGLRDEYKKYSEDKKWSVRKKYFIGQSTKVILFAGRLDPVKGVEYLIKSFKRIVRKHPDSLLIIAGEGSFNLLLKDSGDCWTKIIFTGKLEKKQLYEFYQIADVGVVPSIHEEFGYVAIEMMMHRLPVIVTNTGGLAEIIDDKVTGLKVPVVEKGDRNRVLDIALLSKKIKLLIENPGFARILGENGRKNFLEQYELKSFRENMLNFYSKL
jgi:glycosyltransferase